jgi:hypothetical protein
MTTTRVFFNYDSEQSLNEQIIRFMAKRGFIVERACPERITVKELAARVGRKVGSVSRSLRSPRCPAWDAITGRGERRRRILRIAPSERLISFLTL